METQKAPKGAPQPCAGHDQIDEAVVLEVFSGLEIIGEFLPKGLLDHPPAGKTDQGPGLSQDQVAKHGEAGGDAASGGVR